MKKRRASFQTNSSNSNDAQPARVPVRFRPGLERRIASYAMTAGAASLGLLGLAQPAKADIVYTPADIPLFAGADVDFHVVPPFWGTFSIWDYGRAWDYGVLGGRRVVGHLSVGTGLLNTAKLHAGEPIGPSMPFGSRGRLASFNGSFGFWGGTLELSSSGPWAGRGLGFLGLEFTISGQVYFGWAQLDVEDLDRETGGYDGELIGYAYETTPNQGLLAGEGNGTPEPGTLGLLALGSLGLGYWRRRRAVGGRP